MNQVSEYEDAASRRTTIDDRFWVVVTFPNGDQDHEVDMDDSVGGRARERARRMSMKANKYKTVEVFDRMARRGTVQLWVYANGFLVKTVERWDD